ncbi:MAG TPA: hydrolase TatD [Firmicutes bacterium]|nr:hydrolase TatD [Bacillota bacterium]
MIMLFDTHTHVNDDKLYEDRKEVISRALQNSVKVILNTGDNFASLERIKKLTEEFPGICYSVFGIHPSFCKEYDAKKLSTYISENINSVLAVGEIGLDYFYEVSEEEKILQKEVFISEIMLAKRYQLPIVVHSRSADEDTFVILNEYAKNMKVDLHCFSGSVEMAERYIKNIPNIMFGIGGVLTFNNAKRLVDVVKKVPLKHLLLETDAPYLSPSPYRGKINEPKSIKIIAEKLSEILGLEFSEIEKATTLNARRFFNL